MSEYVLKGKADMSQHDQALKRSADQIYKYKRKVDDAKKSFDGMLKGVGKIAGALGLATGAMATFQAAIKSNEEWSDKWNRTQRVLNTSINEMFTSIKNGNFKDFIRDLKDTAKAAAEAYDALDSLDTFKAFQTPELAKNQRDINEAEYMIKAIKQGKESGNLKEWQNKLNRLVEDRANLMDQTMAHVQKAIDALDKEVSGKFAKYSWYSSFQEKYTRSGGSGYEAASELRDALKAQQRELETQKQYYYGLGQAGHFPTAKERKENTANLIAATNELSKWNDQYEAQLNYLDAILDREEKIRERDNLRTELYQQQGQKFQNKMSTLRYTKEDSGSSSEASNVSEPIEVEVEPVFEPTYVRGSLTDLQTQIAGYKVLLQMAVDQDDVELVEQLNTLIADLQSVADEKEISLGLKVREASEDLSESTNIKEHINDWNELSGIFNEINSSISTVNSALSKTNNSLMDIFTTVLSGVANIIPKIIALTAAQEGEAIASGTASAAKMPYPANIAAIASIVAEIMAVFASIATFADGGIVGGHTTVGDYNLARVNKGEMILNPTQQTRLWKVLNGADSNSIHSGEVTFKIQGSELVGVLNNYNSKKGRIR